jgi:hypothetical protein
VLAAGTLIAVPYALTYDSMIAAIAGAWLVRAGRDSGFLRWESPLLVTIYLMPLFAFQAGLVLHVPLAPFRLRCISAAVWITRVAGIQSPAGEFSGQQNGWGARSRLGRCDCGAAG